MQFQEIRLKLTVTSHGYVRQLAYDYKYIRVLVHVYMQNFTSDRLYSKALPGADSGGGAPRRTPPP